MVAIEHDVALSAEGRFAVPGFRGWAIIAVLAVLTGGFGIAAGSFTADGFRSGSELIWRFTFFVYFAAIVAGPLARLIPWQRWRVVFENRLQLVWGFCASFAVYLASLYMPSLFASVGPTGISGYDIFGGCLILLIACAASGHAVLFLGEKTRGAILGGGLFCFWLAYALTGLEHISGPHRPDVFYDFSLLLMIAALLLRFADNFAAKVRVGRNSA